MVYSLKYKELEWEGANNTYPSNIYLEVSYSEDKGLLFNTITITLLDPRTLEEKTSFNITPQEFTAQFSFLESRILKDIAELDNELAYWPADADYMGDR